jgi:hypothetical protein
MVEKSDRARPVIIPRINNQDAPVRQTPNNAGSKGWLSLGELPPSALGEPFPYGGKDWLSPAELPPWGRSAPFPQERIPGGPAARPRIPASKVQPESAFEGLKLQATAPDEAKSFIEAILASDSKKLDAVIKQYVEKHRGDTNFGAREDLAVLSAAAVRFVHHHPSEQRYKSAAARLAQGALDLSRVSEPEFVKQLGATSRDKKIPDLWREAYHWAREKQGNRALDAS